MTSLNMRSQIEITRDLGSLANPQQRQSQYPPLQPVHVTVAASQNTLQSEPNLLPKEPAPERVDRVFPTQNTMPLPRHALLQEATSSYNITSSPIDSSEDEEDLLDDFFEWEIAKARRDKYKGLWFNAKATVQDNMWRVEHLKAMSNPLSNEYQVGLRHGLPDGMMRNFRVEFRAFKEYYRSREQQAAVGLLGIAQG